MDGVIGDRPSRLRPCNNVGVIWQFLYVCVDGFHVCRFRFYVSNYRCRFNSQIGIDCCNTDFIFCTRLKIWKKIGYDSSTDVGDYWFLLHIIIKWLIVISKANVTLKQWYWTRLVSNLCPGSPPLQSAYAYSWVYLTFSNIQALQPVNTEHKSSVPKH